MNRALRVMLFTASVAVCQPTVAPTDAPVGTRRGEDHEGYNITNSWEVGYRWRDVNGNLGRYRSDVNFGNGIRLLGSTLTAHSKEGQGKYFDELLLSTQGLGNDPYEFASLRIQKNKLYRYDLLWRENAYYNPVLPIAGGQHFMDTTRRMQDQQLVLFPQAPFRILAGYTRNGQSGPALSTVNFDLHRGDEFPLLTDVRRLQDEYRIGFEVQVKGIKLFVQRGWEFFRDDTEFNSGLQAGNNLADLNQLTTFHRSEPYHGDTGNWRVYLITEHPKWYSLNGRFTYAGTRRNFIFDETALGLDRLGSARNRQVFVSGEGRRPVLAANLTTTLNPTGALTLVNHTAYTSSRMDGDGAYQEINNATAFSPLIYFQYLGIQAITTSTDVTYRITPELGLMGGYQYAARDIRSVKQLSFGGPLPDREESEQKNHINVGRFGARYRPMKPLNIIVDAEIGRANHPVYPTSEKNYHAISARVRYRTGPLTLGGQIWTNYNFNPTSLFSHSARTRSYALDASWSTLSWIGVDAAYSKLHLDTLSGIAYFFNGSLIQNDQSRYISNLHSGSITVRLSAGPRVDLFAGYVRTQDTGSDEPSRGRLGFQTYPLTLNSPLARVSVRINDKLRWNAGYQFYGYNEQLLPAQNYNANTGYTSLSWSF